MHQYLLPLAIGFVLDSIFGDPYRLPHPIRTFGNAISFAEKKLNRLSHKKAKGALMTITLVLSTWCIFFGIEQIANSNYYLHLIVVGVFVFYGLANHSLIREGLAVEKALSEEGLEAGRHRLSYIVGRDTSQLSAQEIRKAVLETLSENLSDGIIAPLFFYALGGIPAMFSYKMINTLDSMIGYKSERYKDFGFFAAKTDDVVNYIPARITALLIAIVAFSPRAFQFIIKFGNKHSSPNAGYPESALAGVLHCRFGGPSIYHGTVMDKPYIGTNNRSLHAKDIHRTCIVNALASFLFFAICCAILFLLY